MKVSKFYCPSTCKARGTTPTAEHTEYLPPTQSQNPNTLSALIPKSTAFGIAELKREVVKTEKLKRKERKYVCLLLNETIKNTNRGKTNP